MQTICQHLGSGPQAGSKDSREVDGSGASADAVCSKGEGVLRCRDYLAEAKNEREERDKLRDISRRMAELYSAESLARTATPSQVRDASQPSCAPSDALPCQYGSTRTRMHKDAGPPCDGRILLCVSHPGIATVH